MNRLVVLFALLCIQTTVFAQNPAGGYSSGGTSGGGGNEVTPLPNTSLDVFDRSGANLGSNYTDYVNSWVPNSGAAHGTTAALFDVSAYTGATSVSGYQEARVVVAALNGSTDQIGAAVRIGGTAHTSASFYACSETSTALKLFKVTGATDSSLGTITSLHTDVAITAAVGDILDVTVVGGTVTCNWDNWANSIQGTDGSPLSGGSPGVEQIGNVAEISSFILTSGALAANADLNLVFDGDSITVGYPAAVPASAAIRVGGYKNPSMTNVAVPSKALGVSNSGIETMLSTGTSVVDPLFKSGIKNILVIWGCSNDLALDSRTAAQCYADLQTYVSARHTTGWKVIVVTLLSRTGSADAPMQQFNELLLANSSFADALVTLPVGLIGTHAYSNATLFSADGIHPTQLTQLTILAPLLSSAIGRL